MKKNAKYRAFPNLSPYSMTDRFENPKEDHKFLANKISKLVDIKSNIKICDLGCGNGEFLYHLNKFYPDWELDGFDFTQEFIDVGNNYIDSDKVNLYKRDIFEVTGEYDVVISDGVTQIFDDVEKILNKYLDLCKEGGVILTTGRFNKYDIEVRMQYCDNTHDEARGIWRSDWCFHSQESIIKIFNNKVKFLEFEEVIMDKDLIFDENDPIRQWTFRDSNGKNIITNGTNFILNKTLLIMKK